MSIAKLQKNSFFFIVLFFSMFVFSHQARAASITFQTSSTVVHQAQNIAIDVLLDPQGQNVNTVSATVSIPTDLDYVGVDDSSSIISLWVDEPKFDKKTRTMTLSGIIPGGFAGSIDPFNPSEYKAGILIRLLLRGRTAGSGLFSLPDVEAYLNDGLGTQTHVSSGSLPLVVDELLQPGSLDFFPDNQAPLEFQPVVERDLLLYDNQRVLIFNTKDKGSGMDHYEVKEGNASWVVAVSPYLLKDQEMKGDILVKAVDRDGNERIEAIPAANPFNKWQIVGLFVVFILLVVLTMMHLSHHMHHSIKKHIEKKETEKGGSAKEDVIQKV
ncbi:MAG: hypothetical protein WCG55_00305 [bacterium]